MPHVSRRKLEEKLLGEMHERLITVLADLSARGEMGDFLSDLLTATEKVMLAKRLAIVLMLDKGYPFQIISRALKVSEATVSVMRERIDRGGRGFDLVLKKLKREQKIDRILGILDRVIRVFAMPPIAGKRRWRLLSELPDA